MSPEKRLLTILIAGFFAAIALLCGGLIAEAVVVQGLGGHEWPRILGEAAAGGLCLALAIFLATA